MKTLFLLSLGCLLTSAATAQTEKGTRYIGATLGELSYSKAKQNYGNSRFSVSLYPSAGVFVADNFLLGATLALSYSSLKPGNTLGDYSIRALGYGVSPFARYYLPSTSAHRFFGQLTAGVLAQTAWYPNYSGQERERNTESAVAYGAAVGYNYFLVPGVALEALAGYSRTTNNRTSLGAGSFDVRAGFSIFLPSKGTGAPAE